MNTDTFEAEMRARIEAAGTDDSALLAIANGLLQKAVAQSARAQAIATDARMKAAHAVQVGERLAAETQRITEALSGSVAFIRDEEEVLHFKRDTDPHKLMALLLRAVDECRWMIAAEAAASRTLQ